MAPEEREPLPPLAAQFSEPSRSFPFLTV